MRNVKRLKICIFDASALTNESYSHLIMRDNSDVDVHRASCQKFGRQDLHWPVATFVQDVDFDCSGVQGACRCGERGARRVVGGQATEVTSYLNPSQSIS